MELCSNYIKKIDDELWKENPKKVFFTNNFLKKISSILQNNQKLDQAIKFRLKAVNRLKDKKQKDLIFQNYKLTESENLNHNFKLSKKYLWYILELENCSDNLKKFIESIQEFDDIWDNLLIIIFSKKANKEIIKKSITHNQKINQNSYFQQNKKYFFSLLDDEELLNEYYNFIANWLSKINHIINENPININIDVIDCSEYNWIENFFEEIDFNASAWLNKQNIAKKWLNPNQKTSWNRHLLQKEKLINNEDLEKLQQISILYIDFVDEISKDPQIRERLKKEIWLDDKLEDIYFGQMSKEQVFRIDATCWEHNSIYEFDDFPRGIWISYLQDIYNKQKSWWTKHIRNILENENDVFVFLIHDDASWACKHEHQEMTRFLKEKEWINAIFITSSEFKQKAKYSQNNEGISIDWYNIKWVWHHLMMTEQTWEILPELDKNNIKILPHFHVSSHKWVNSILWEKYKDWTLDDKYSSLIEEWFFAETVNITNEKQWFNFKWIDYKSLKDFLEKNNIDELKNVVIKIVWAENAEWVTVFATLTKKLLKEKKKSLLKHAEKWFDKWTNILLQENKAHTVLSRAVYNSKEDYYEIFEGNFINRIFFDWNWNFISWISQITKYSNIDKSDWTKKGYWTAHWMVDMTVTSV